MGAKHNYIHTQRIKARREELGVSLERLGQLVSAKPESLAKFEIGKTDIPARYISKIAEALSTSADYLLGMTEKEELRDDELSRQEREILRIFRTKNHAERSKIIELARRY